MNLFIDHVTVFRSNMEDENICMSNVEDVRVYDMVEYKEWTSYLIVT